jgi:antitoxin component YwqK of YwqJK toxin-antitoxin module
MEVLLKGEAYSNEGEYELAVQEFDKVHEGDSLFFRFSVHMKMVALNNLEEYQKVKDLGDKYWYFRYDLPTEFYLNYGTALDNLKEYDKAQEMYQSILKEYPMNYSLWYNLGISQLLEGDHKEAYTTFKKTIEINPFYDRVHLGMARLAFAEQQTSKGIMALGRYLLHSANLRNNFTQLQYGDYMASTKYWTDDDFSGSNNLELDGNNSFETIDQLVHNYVALRDKYKTPSKLEYSLIKQLHLIASQLKDQKANEEDYWYKTYGKFYVELLNNKQFEGFSYVISNFAKNEQIKKVVSKKSKDLKETYAWAMQYLKESNKKADLSFIGFGESNVSRNSDNYHIEIMGDFEYKNNEEIIVGDIKFYGDEGRMTAEGSFSEKGEKDGLWKYYHSNGRLRETQVLKNGVKTDTSYMYHANGLLNVKVPFKEGKITGEVSLYRNGVLWRTLPYKEGEVNSGEMVDYHPIGTTDIKYQLTDGKANGDFESFYDSGQTYRKGSFLNGDLQGERITHFKSGEISYKENFLDDQREGMYISYFQDGQIESKGQFKEGSKIGTWEYFYRNGNKNKVQNFDDRGKENGLETKYSEEGWKASEHSFNKGVVDAYTFFNRSGEILSQGERKGGDLKYISYYHNGIKKAEGQFNKESRNGEWKFYSYNGALQRIENYKDAKRVGSYEEYFPNGSSEVNYEFNENGDSEGYYHNMYRNEKIYRQGFLKEGERDGPWETYNRDGKLRSSNFYSNQNLQGFSTRYDVVGNPIQSLYYIDDLHMFTIYFDTAGVAFDTIFQKPGNRINELRRCADCPVFMTVDIYNNTYHGEQVFYYPDGTLEAKGKVFNGDKEGLWKTHHPNGKLASEGSYIDGESHGEWKYYNENGVLIRLSNYTNGDLNGAYETYDDDGDIDFKANYSYGNLHSDIYYYVGKKQDHKRTYSYGYIETYTYTDKNGKEVTKEMSKESADIITYWANGKKAREFTIKNGWFEGPYNKYYDNGQQAQDQNYKQGLKEGVYKSYFKNGKLKSEGQYEQGNLVGLFTTYYSNGKKRSEKHYILDKLHGDVKHYDENGDITSTITYINGNAITIEKK